MIKLPTLPMEVSARDYHEFDTMVQTLKEFGITGVKYVECGCSGQYYAIFYQGKKNLEVKAMIKTLTKEINDANEINDS